METKKVLFFVEAVTAAHLIRVLPLAKSLSGQHKVFLATLNPPSELKNKILDIEFLPLDSTVPPKEFLEGLYQGCLPYNESRLREQMAEDMKIIKQVRPDLIVVDFRLSISLQASTLGIPIVNLQNAFWSSRYSFKNPMPDIPLSRLLGSTASSIFEKVLWSPLLSRPILNRFLRPFNKIRKEIHLAPFSQLQDLYSFGDRLVHPDPLELFENGRPWDSLFLGPITNMPEIPKPDWLHKLDPQKKTIYISMGSSGRSEKLMRILPDLIKEPYQWVIISNEDETKSLVAENIFVDQFVSLPQLAPHVDFAIINGGSAQGYFFLSQGIPFLGIASNMDQHLFSQCVTRKQLAYYIRSETLTLKKVREFIKKGVWNQELKMRCEGFARILQSYQPERTFTLEIDEILKKQSRPLPLEQRIQ